MKRKLSMKRRNPDRKATEFKRCYGSAERVEAINDMPCVVWREGLCRGPIENAHIPSKSGMSRKGDACHVVPLCWLHHNSGDPLCLHEMGKEAFNGWHAIDLDAEAARIEALWPTSSRDEHDPGVEEAPCSVLVPDEPIATPLDLDHPVAGHEIEPASSQRPIQTE